MVVDDYDAALELSNSFLLELFCQSIGGLSKSIYVLVGLFSLGGSLYPFNDGVDVTDLIAKLRLVVLSE
jgi:hypothetical protein